MKIAIVHYSAPPVVGGVEATVFNHARYLSELGHECVLVAGEGGETGDPRIRSIIIPRMASRNDEILAVKRDLDRGVVPDGFAALQDALAKELHAALADADVIIVHNICVLNKNLALTAALRGLCEGALAGKRWLGWHHDFAWVMEQYGAELHPGLPWAMLRAPWAGMTNVTVSEARRNALAILYGVPPESIQVVQPGVEEAHLLALTPTVSKINRALEQADLILFQPSRITRRKNIELAFRTLAVARQRTGLDIRLLISGPPGPHNPSNQSYLDMLRALRDELGLREKAYFLRLDEIDGATLDADLSDADVGALYRMCDILFLPSTDEGFGMPVLEAVAVGRAIVCSDLPVLRESGGNTATYIDPRGSEEDAANAIVGLIHNLPRIMQRRRALQRFSWGAVVRRDVLPLLNG